VRRSAGGPGPAVAGIMTGVRSCRALMVAFLFVPGLAAAELVLPPGFTAQVYVTGEGFDPGRGARAR